MSNYELTGDLHPDSQMLCSEFDDEGALQVTACEQAMVFEYRALIVGTVDTFTLGSRVCPQPAA